MTPQSRAAPVQEHLGAWADRSDGSAATTSGGISTPHCQRTWFFDDVGAVRVEHVALVEHRVGDPRAPRRGRQRGVIARLLEQPADRVVPADQAVPRRGRRRAGRRSPGTAAARPGRGSARPSPRARPPPAAGRRLLVPRHRLTAIEPAAPVKTCPLNSSSSGTSPVLEAGEVLVRGDLDVVAARQREVEVAVAGEARAAPAPGTRAAAAAWSGPSAAGRRRGRRPGPPRRSS